MSNETPNIGAPKGDRDQDAGSAKRARQTANARIANSRQHEVSDDKRREFVEYVRAVDALLPAGVLDLIVERVLRDVYRKNPALKKAPKRQPGTVVNKIFNIAPGAFEQSVRIHARLVEENERAERLLLQLRQARAELLKTSGVSGQ